MSTYLDHAATTPVRPVAREAMLPWLGERHGNPSGGHAMARAARKAIDEAREVVAAALGCQPGEVVFTSGGTESDNLAVAGVAGATGGAALCAATEHHAVLNPVLARGGRAVPVAPDGRIDLDALAAALDEEGERVRLVAAMLVNNEVGTIQDLDEVARVVAAHAPQANLHTDAVQALTWLDVPRRASSAHLIAISGHKIGGPQGVGALVVRDGVELEPLLRGGGQERDRRSGTHNVAGIVGMAAAVQETVATRDETVSTLGRLRDRLADGLIAAIPGCRESGDRSSKVAGMCSLLIEGIESESLLFLLDREELCATAASSCASGALDPSHVLAAMGIPRDLAQGSLRLSLGWSTTPADIDRALALIPPSVAALRQRSAAPVLR